VAAPNRGTLRGRYRVGLSCVWQIRQVVLAAQPKMSQGAPSPDHESAISQREIEAR